MCSIFPASFFFFLGYNIRLICFSLWFGWISGSLNETEIPRVGILNDTKCAGYVPLSNNILTKWLAFGLVTMATAVLSTGNPTSLKYLVWWDLHQLLRHGLWRSPLWIRFSANLKGNPGLGLAASRALFQDHIDKFLWVAFGSL